MSDKYDEQVERLLPCWYPGPCEHLGPREGKMILHIIGCPAYYRSAVTAALRELGEDRDKLCARCNAKDDEFAQQVAFTDKIIADLRAENERLTKVLQEVEPLKIIAFD